MGRSIFISYKYGDKTVHGQGMTVRNYVDALQALLDKENYEDKGEPDNLDLSQLSDDAIRKELSDRMFYSSVTIVLISPNMKEPGPERDQWIPWEVAYSLRTKNREHGNSNPNAMIAVVLPDANSSYGYYIKDNICSDCNARTLKTETLFPILEKNMFNIDPKKIQYSDCLSHNSRVRLSDSSHYIESVMWDDFTADPNEYIERALKRQRNLNDYTLVKQLEQ